MISAAAGCSSCCSHSLLPANGLGLSLLDIGKELTTRTKTKRMMDSTKQQKEKEREVDLDPRPRNTVSAWPLSLKVRYPTSPGMFTYRFPPNVFASGILRFGGVALGVGFTGVVLGSTGLYAATVEKKKLGYFITSLGESLPRSLICACKMCVCFPLLGHFLGGIRDIGWHLGIQSLEKEYCKGTSLGIIALSLAGSGALAFTRFGPYDTKLKVEE